jgi:hypothetical protein
MLRTIETPRRIAKQDVALMYLRSAVANLDQNATYLEDLTSIERDILDALLSLNQTRRDEE